VAPRTTPEELDRLLTDLNADWGLTRKMRAVAPKTELGNTSGNTANTSGNTTVKSY
jgi:hypothetical protein